MAGKPPAAPCALLGRCGACRQELLGGQCSRPSATRTEVKKEVSKTDGAGVSVGLSKTLEWPKLFSGDAIPKAKLPPGPVLGN